MQKMRVDIYLEKEQHVRLKWESQFSSLSEVGRRAIREYLKRQVGYRQRRYNPDNPPGRKPSWRRTG